MLQTWCPVKLFGCQSALNPKVCWDIAGGRRTNRAHFMYSLSAFLSITSQQIIVLVTSLPHWLIFIDKVALEHDSYLFVLQLYSYFHVQWAGLQAVGGDVIHTVYYLSCMGRFCQPLFYMQVLQFCCVFHSKSNRNFLVFTQRLKMLYPAIKNLLVDIYSSFIHNCWNLKAIKMPFSRWMDTLNCAFLSNDEILPNSKRNELEAIKTWRSVHAY